MLTFIPSILVISRIASLVCDIARSELKEKTSRRAASGSYGKATMYQHEVSTLGGHWILPPFSHRTRGASSGVCRLSKNLRRTNRGARHYLSSKGCNDLLVPEEQMLVLINI